MNHMFIYMYMLLVQGFRFLRSSDMETAKFHGLRQQKENLCFGFKGVGNLLT